MGDRDLPEFDAATLPPPLGWKGKIIWRTDLNSVQYSNGSAWIAPTYQDPITGALVGAGGESLRLAQRTTAIDQRGLPITGPAGNVITPGKVVIPGNAAYTINGGTPTVSQVDGYSGMPTGVRSLNGSPTFTKVVCGSATDEIILSVANTPQFRIDYSLGLLVYLHQQPGYAAPVGALAGIIDLSITTDAGGSFTNGRICSWNTNQLREGWNFLVVRPSSSVHPLGVSTSALGTGANGDGYAADVRRIKIAIKNLNVGGTEVYIGPLMTGFRRRPGLVIGVDQTSADTIDHVLPLFQQYGWVGYVAPPRSVWVSGSTLLEDDTANVPTRALQLHNAGWDVVNHTVTHRALGSFTAQGEIGYEIEGWKRWISGYGIFRGTEFYASPTSSVSREAEALVRSVGVKLQRHARKWDVQCMPWGLDNPHHVGAVDWGSTTNYSTATKMKQFIDVIVDYEAVGFPFFHSVTTLGDNGSGEQVGPDSLTLYRSNLAATLAYARQLEQAGSLTIHRGISGFYYGSQ